MPKTKYSRVTEVLGLAALLLAAVSVGRAAAETSAGAEDVSKAAEICLANEPFDQNAAASLLLNPGLSKPHFVELVKKSEGQGRVMETLSLFASSPPMLNGRFQQVSEAVRLFPDSEAAKYLASNRYLEESQMALLAKIAKSRPNSLLAGELAGNLSLSGEAIRILSEAVQSNTGTYLAERLAGSEALPEEFQGAFCSQALLAPNSQFAEMLAKNKRLQTGVKDKIGAAVIESPDTLLARSFGLNQGLSGSQIKAVLTIALSAPDSRLAEGVGKNPVLQGEHYELVIPAVKSNFGSKLVTGLCENPSVPDKVFNLLLEGVKKNPESPCGIALASAGGAASSPARIANVANLVISDPNLPFASQITTNPLVPTDFFDALVNAAIGSPKSALCQAFVEDIKNKRFRGGHPQKMKLLEVSLTYGGN